jgi:hypothetical protein
MTRGITLNPRVSVSLEGVQMRVALGSSVELDARLRYAQFAYACYRVIVVDDDFDQFSRAGVVFPGRSD